MPRRYVSEKQLSFVIGGRPLCPGNTSSGGITKKGFTGGSKTYQTLVRLSCKAAMVEQGWTKEEGPLYMVISIYFGFGHENLKHVQRDMLKGAILPMRLPNITRLPRVVIQALKGIAFKSEKQIDGLLVVKRYSKEERVEVLIGAPKNIQELNYDLRNA